MQKATATEFREVTTSLNDATCICIPLHPLTRALDSLTKRTSFAAEGIAAAKSLKASSIFSNVLSFHGQSLEYKPFFLRRIVANIVMSTFPTRTTTGQPGVFILGIRGTFSAHMS